MCMIHWLLSLAVVFKVTSQAQGQAYDCLIGNEEIRRNIGKKHIFENCQYQQTKTSHKNGENNAQVTHQISSYQLTTSQSTSLAVLWYYFDLHVYVGA